MESVLEKQESDYWNFPSVHEWDDSTTKFDTLTIYEDNHGQGTLESATEFSFTSENDNVWLLPSKSYISVSYTLRKATGGAEYDWGTDGVNLTDCGFNLFNEARYYIGQEEIERVDHLGMAATVNGLMEMDLSEQNVAKHTQLMFYGDDETRKVYVENCKGHIFLLLPLSKIFSFCKYNCHVFRGLKHRMTLTMNVVNNLISAAAGVAEGNIKVKHIEWHMPMVEPSLSMMSKLESQLAHTTKWKLKWRALTVIDHTNAHKHNKVRIPLACTVHKPTNVVVGFQTIAHQNSQSHNSLRFEHMKIGEIFVEINNVRYPDKPIKMNFGNKNATVPYKLFLDGCENKTSFLDYETYISKYPLINIDVSKHKPELYENVSFPHITIDLTFDANPTENYTTWVFIYNKREATLNLENKKMFVLK